MKGRCGLVDERTINVETTVNKRVFRELKVFRTYRTSEGNFYSCIGRTKQVSCVLKKGY